MSDSGEHWTERLRRRGWWWEVSNTNVGILLLSTVLLGGGAAMFTWIRDQAREAEARRARAERLDLEIGSRLEAAYTRAMRGRITDSVGDPEKMFLSGGGGIGMFPEHREQSLASLMWQLHHELPEDERVGVADALHKVRAATAGGLIRSEARLLLFVGDLQRQRPAWRPDRGIERTIEERLRLVDQMERSLDSVARASGIDTILRNRLRDTVPQSRGVATDTGPTR